MSAAEQFATFVRHHAVKAGHDLSGPRSGGRKSLADDSGISHASICRMLNGQTIPVAECLESLADAIDVPVGQLLELAGIVSPGALAESPPEAKPLTVKQAAGRLGIRRPLHVALLEAVVATLLTEQEATA